MRRPSAAASPERRFIQGVSQRQHGSCQAKSAWFAGNDFTAADIQMSFPLEAPAARGGLDATRPRLMAFPERIYARPAYKRALGRGGPYELLS